VLEPDVVHCHDLDTAPAGLRARRECGMPPRLVLDMHELYRESNMVPRGGVAGVVAQAAVRLMERRAFAAADAILVANPGTLDFYESRAGTSKVTVVENAPDPDLFRPRVGRRPDRPFTVGFMGQMRYLEGLRTLIEAVGTTEGASVVLAGGGTCAGEVARSAAPFASVRVSGPFAYTELPGLYELCDCVYAVYDTRIGSARRSAPVKMMEAMACALPVIVAEGTWAGDYAAEHGVGLTVPANDVPALQAAVGALMRDPDAAAEMGRRGRVMIEEGLNWPAAAARLVQTYDRLRD
jgi:glycosyltransferase involved in cell wall biosynthesis